MINNRIISIQLKYPHFDNIDIAINKGKEWQKKSTNITINNISLDVGCGLNPRNPFMAETLMGVDLIKDKSNKNNNLIMTIADLSTGRLPFKDKYFDYITAFDFIEHLPRTNFQNETLNPFINFMNEVSRILKSGGVFLSHTPAYPFEAVFSDPTHQNIITEKTFPYYFTCTPPFEEPWARMYGYKGDLKMITQYWLHDHLVTVLGKE